MPTDEQTQGPPPWITTERGPDGKPGIPPVADVRTNPVTDEEIAAQLRRNEAELAEALAHYQSKGAAMATEEQRFMGQQQALVDSHRANLEMFEGAFRKGHPEVIRQIIQHSQALASALLHLGQFDEVIATLHTVGGFEADLLRQTAIEWKRADERPNDEQCTCEPPSTDEHIDAMGNSIPKKIAARKHFRAGKFRSVTQGQVVAVHTCGVCGHQNAYPTNDAEHADLLAARQAAEHNVRIAGLKGRQARAHLERLGHRGDEVHLAVKDEEQVMPVQETVISQ